MNYLDPTYNWAKRLRNARYPQGVGTWIDEEGNKVRAHDEHIENLGSYGTWAYLPKLGELIKECGDGYFSLGRDGSGQWRAMIEKKLGEVYHTDIDDTAEEAVSNLWLLIKQKKKAFIKTLDKR